MAGVSAPGQLRSFATDRTLTRRVCFGRTVPMEKLDTLVADHIERRLLQPARLEQILSSVLDRRGERAERQATHVAALRKRAVARNDHYIPFHRR